MYFLWKRTPHGSIRVSCDGLSGFIDRILSEKSRCRSLSLAEGESAAVTLVLSSEDSVSKGALIEERISSIVAPLGFRVNVIWVDRGVPETEWVELLSSLYRNPWFWMLVAVVVTLTVVAGLKGLFWTLFWGTAAWFVSRLLISFAIRKRLGFFPPLVRR
ncbi:MAG: hypothetical protein LBR61_03635 [Synergistaceae bacterium]|jgi:hypothetical protein|nr:hypothetical protein [Synergistaceae bacterium]